MERQYKDSGIEWIGRIPETWKSSQLSVLFSEHSNKNVGMQETNLLSLSYGKIIRKNINENGGLLPESFEGYNIIDKGDIVFRLTDLQNDKRSLRTGICQERGIITSAYVTVRIRDNKHLPSYFHYLLHSCDECKVFYGLGAGVRQGMNYQDLKKLGIIIPSIAEQQRISDFLDEKCGEMDSLIGLQEQMIEKLKAYKQSVITEAVTKGLNPNAKLVPSGIDWIGEIPDGWKVCRIKDMVNLQSGTNLTTMDISDNGTYPVYGGNGLRGYIKDFSNDGDYILIGRQGALCGNINYASGKFWATEHAVVCYPKRKFPRTWFGELLRAMNLGQYSLSAAQPGLAVERIKNLKMPLPSDEEQYAIATYLDDKCSEIDSLIAVKQQKIEKLKDYKKSVIYEAVTGKTIV